MTAPGIERVQRNGDFQTIYFTNGSCVYDSSTQAPDGTWEDGPGVESVIALARAAHVQRRADPDREQEVTPVVPAYPRIDGPHLILGPECFTGDGNEVDQSVISWRGENYYRSAQSAPVVLDREKALVVLNDLIEGEIYHTVQQALDDLEACVLQEPGQPGKSGGDGAGLVGRQFSTVPAAAPQAIDRDALIALIREETVGIPVDRFVNEFADRILALPKMDEPGEQWKPHVEIEDTTPQLGPRLFEAEAKLSKIEALMTEPGPDGVFRWKVGHARKRVRAILRGEDA